MSLCGCLSVCVITWLKIYQEGGPETFLTLLGLIICSSFLFMHIYICCVLCGRIRNKTNTTVNRQKFTVKVLRIAKMTNINCIKSF